MCGICGIADFSRAIDDGGAAVARMNSTLVHRGPDDEGFLARPSAALAMRRLSIIDIGGGRQPISNEDGLISIVYNGETYNFQELRARLAGKGHVFKTSTDTEVIVHLYEEYGVKSLEHLNGMYAFAILDEKENRLLLARDRLGIKPLYYYFSGGRLYFASEIKALLAHPDVPRRMDMQSLSHYLAHLYVPAPRTIFEGIRCLQPGHFIMFDGGRCEPECYWNLDFSPKKISEDEAAEQLEALLADAVKISLVSDVPLGAFLSGGMDSSAITALMSLAAGGRVKTFSIGFKDESFDERRFARMVAERYATDHEEFVVDYPDVTDFLPKLARCFDQPFADAAAIPAFILARNARKKVTVALSGNGGDELFGGYTKYLAEKYYRIMKLAPAAAREVISATLEKLLPETPELADRNRRIKRLLRYSLLPDAVRPVSWSVGFDAASQSALFSPGAAREIDFGATLSPWLDQFNACGAADVLSRQMFTDIKVYLPDNNLLKDDITGMANSLETRVPLLDHRVAEFAASLPPGFHVNGFQMKHILKKAMKKYLPGEILNRPKQGFTVPVGNWINGQLSGYADEMLVSETSPIREYFDVKEVRRYLDEHRAGRADHAMRLWALIVFRVWREEYL